MNFKKSIILQINWYLTPTNSSHSDTHQVKSSILVKQTDLCYIWCSHEQIVIQFDIFVLPTILRTYILLGALVRFQNYPNDL